ncbi:hypothetical protein KRP22_013280 [Phytophthora ramorum]|nr:hypothetical protein KRP22_10932 [Phytophthora ramorum]
MPVMLVPVVVAVNEAVVVAEDVTVAEDAELDVKVSAEVAEKEGLLRPRRASDEREGGEYDATRCDIQKPPEGRATNGKAASTTPLDATSRSVGGGATPVVQDAGDAGARGRGRGRGHGRGRGRGGAAVAAALALAASDSDESLLLDSADDDVVLVGGPYIMDYPPFDR